MVYFLYESYSPNTAATNRALAYLRSFEQLKIAIEVVFFLPNSEKSRIEDDFHYVHITYCWDSFYINHRVLRYISYCYYVYKLLWKLRRGDKVYFYGLNDIKGLFIRKKGIEVYYEETECPDASLTGTGFRKFTVSQHIEECKKLTGLIVISQALKDYFTDKGVNNDKIHIVNMTVDANRFSGLQKVNVSEKYVAYCGTVSNNKDGVDKLIRAFALLSGKHPDLKLYIIGKIPRKDEENGNIRLIRELGIEDKVRLTGVVPAEQMPQMLKDAVMLALARPNNLQAKYGFPTKLGEYLLTGNPVVVTDVGDISKFLTDGVDALIANPNSDEEFAAKMEYVIRYPDEAKRIGEQGAIIAREVFNSKKETIKLINVLGIDI